MRRTIRICEKVSHHSFEEDGKQYRTRINDDGSIGETCALDGTIPYNTTRVTMDSDVRGFAIPDTDGAKIVTADGMSMIMPDNIKLASIAPLRGWWYRWEAETLYIVSIGKILMAFMCPIAPTAIVRLGPYDVMCDIGWVLYVEPYESPQRLILPCRGPVLYVAYIGDRRYLIVTKYRAYVIVDGKLAAVDHDHLANFTAIGGQLYTTNPVRRVEITFG